MLVAEKTAITRSMMIGDMLVSVIMKINSCLVNVHMFKSTLIYWDTKV